MDSETYYSIAGAIVAVLSGLAGTFFDTKDRDGRRTPFVWLAVVGIILGTGISFTAEMSKRKHDAEAAAASRSQADATFRQAKAAVEEATAIRAETKALSKLAQQTLYQTSGVASSLRDVSVMQGETLAKTRSAARTLEGTAAAVAYNVSLSRHSVKVSSQALHSVNENLTSTRTVNGNTIAVMHDVGRVMYPWKNLGVAFTYEVDVRDQQFRSYEQRLIDAIDATKRSVYPPHTAFEREGTRTSILISAGSPLLPSYEREQSAYLALMDQIARFRIYRGRHAPAAGFENLVDERDLDAQIGALVIPGPGGFHLDNQPETNAAVDQDKYPFLLIYDDAQRTCSVIFGNETKQQFLTPIEGNGASSNTPFNRQVRGLNDVLDSDIVIGFYEGRSLSVSRLGRLRPTNFTLHVGEQTLSLYRNSPLFVRQGTDSHGLAYEVYHLPKDLGELLAATR